MSLAAFKIAAAAVMTEFQQCTALCNELLLAKGDAIRAEQNLDAALLQAATVLEDIFNMAVRPPSPQASDETKLDGAALPQAPPVAQVPLHVPIPHGRQSSFVESAQQPFAEVGQAAQVPLRMPMFQMPFTEVGQTSFAEFAKPLQKRARLDASIDTKPLPQLHEAASGLNAKQKAWFATLPPDKFTDGEDGLRAALLEFLANWQGQRPPAMNAVMNGPVGLAAKGLLAKSVPLTKWVEQRLGDEVDCKRDEGTFYFQKRGAFEICRHYKQGTCTYGDRCRFRHSS